MTTIPSHCFISWKRSNQELSKRIIRNQGQYGSRKIFEAILVDYGVDRLISYAGTASVPITRQGPRSRARMRRQMADGTCRKKADWNLRGSAQNQEIGAVSKGMSAVMLSLKCARVTPRSGGKDSLSSQFLGVKWEKILG